MDYKKYIDGVKNTNTIKSYDSIWRNHLSKFSSDGKIASSKTKQIINYVNGLDKSSSTKKAIFSLLINISSEDTLKKMWRKEQDTMDKMKLKEQDERMKNKGATLPTKEELMLHMKKQYKMDNCISYIVNYLLIYFNVRNMDLVLEMVFKKSEVEPNKNYIVVRGNDCLYVRGNFKTHKIYGDKISVIKSKMFHNCCQELVGKGVDTLLNHDDMEHLTRQVQKHTLNGMNESDYTKIMVSSIDINNNKKALMRIAERRGTSLEVLLSTYKVR